LLKNTNFIYKSKVSVIFADATMKYRHLTTVAPLLWL